MKYPFTPEVLDALPEELAELYRNLENTLLEEICGRLKLADNLNEVTVQDIRALRSMGIDLEDIKEAIAETAKVSDDKLDKLFDEVIQRNQSYYSELVDLAEITKPERFVNASDIDAIRRQTKSEFTNLTQSSGFLVRKGGKLVKLPPAKAYQWALDNAEMQIMSGGISYREAIKNAVKQLAYSGIKTVDYESGHVDHVDVAARRAVMTGVNQVCQKYSEQSVDFLETDLVEVSAHQGARDTGTGPENHKEWQGKVYRWKEKQGNSKENYPDFIETTGYGTGPGLGGWNCRHHFYPFYEGVSERTYTDNHLANIDPPPFEYQGKVYTAYEATQQQRKIERTIRKLKRERAAYEQAGLTEDVQDVSIRIRRLNEEYKAFSKAAGLPMQKERMNILSNSSKKSFIFGSQDAIISSQINQRSGAKGKPSAVKLFDVSLNKRQIKLLDSLPDYDSKVTVSKKSVSMKDLSSLTAKTGVEFAMFTRKSERLIVRGGPSNVNINTAFAAELYRLGYRWSGHTHPGDGLNVKEPSGGDYQILKEFKQSRSVIYDSYGRYSIFGGW